VKETDCWGSPRHKWEVNIRTDLKKWNECVWIGPICLRIRTSDGLSGNFKVP